MSETAGTADRIVSLQQRIHLTLLSSLTENWMAVDLTMPQLKVMLCLFSCCCFPQLFDKQNCSKVENKLKKSRMSSMFYNNA